MIVVCFVNSATKVFSVVNSDLDVFLINFLFHLHFILLLDINLFLAVKNIKYFEFYSFLSTIILVNAFLG